MHSLEQVMKTKDVLYEKFSKNLINIKGLLNFELEESYRNEAYICPLSFNVFTKIALLPNFADQLTLEHVPPEVLGGKGMCLTSRDQNNEAGQYFDIAIINHLNFREFKEGISELKTTAYIDNVKFTSLIKYSDNGNHEIKFLTKTYHQGTQRVFNKLAYENGFNAKFFFPNNSRKAAISILRIAYLYAFSILGYSIIFGLTKIINENYELIRKQILNPKETLIENIVFLDTGLEKIAPGIKIVYEPKEYRSLFVVFDVLTKNKKWRYGVFLPGPDDYGFTAIKKIDLDIKEKRKINFRYQNVKRIDITDPNECLAYYKIWKNQNGIFEV